MALMTSAGPGPMMSAPAGPVMLPPPSAPRMPNLARGPSSASRGGGGAVGDPRKKGAPSDADAEAAFGGDACLCVEFGGSLVSAAAWDASKRAAVALPTSDKGGEQPGPSRARLDVVDPTKFRSWLQKPAKSRAAEIHAAGVVVGSAGDGGAAKATFDRPGLLLGGLVDARRAEGLVSGDFFDVTVEKKKPSALKPSKSRREGEGDDDAEEEEEEEEDSQYGLASLKRFEARAAGGADDADLKVTAEALVALLAARPRQRATQLVAKPVRRATIVCPASATQAWRRAAAEALLLVDARAQRFVSAPLAQLAGLAAREKSALKPSVDDTFLSVTLDEEGAFDGVLAVCVSPPFSFAATRVFASRQDFDHWAAAEDDEASSVTAVVVRRAAGVVAEEDFTLIKGEKVRVVEADQLDAAFGAVALQASRLELPGSVKGTATAVDAVPYPVVLKELLVEGASSPSLPPPPEGGGKGEGKGNGKGGKKEDTTTTTTFADDDDEEVIFDAGAELPASARREYAVADSKKTTSKKTPEWRPLALYERVGDGQLVPCGAGIDDPFLTVDDDGRVVYATEVTVEYFVDKRGLASTQVILARGAPKSAAKEAKERAARNCRRITALCFVTFLLAPVGYTLVHMRQRAITRKLTVAALEDFYSRAKPDKIDEAEKIADKYEGFEDVLYKRLERQYPGFTVTRPSKHAAKAAAKDDDDDAAEDDVDNLDDDDEKNNGKPQEL